MTQRLENTEKGSKNDITELFARIKRYEEEARIDNDEVRKFIKLLSPTKKERRKIKYIFVKVRQALARTTSTLEEKTMRDKRELRSATAVVR